MLFQGVMMFGTGRHKLRALFAIADESCDNVLSADELRESFAFAMKISNRNNPEYQGNPNVITDEQGAIINNAVKAIFDVVDTDHVCYNVSLLCLFCLFHGFVCLFRMDKSSLQSSWQHWTLTQSLSRCFHSSSKHIGTEREIRKR